MWLSEMLVSLLRRNIVLAWLVSVLCSLLLWVNIKIWAAFARGQNVIWPHVGLLATINLSFSEPRRRVVILLTVNVVFWSLEWSQKSILLRVFRRRHRVIIIFAEVLLVAEIYCRLEHRIFGFLTHFVKGNIIRIPRLRVFIEILVSLAFILGVVHSIFILLPSSVSAICKSHTFVYRVHSRGMKFPTGLKHLPKITLRTEFIFLLSRRSIICLIGKHLPSYLRLLIFIDSAHFEIGLHLHVFGYRCASTVEMSILWC